jgi:predicted transcriptional regulator
MQTQPTAGTLSIRLPADLRSRLHNLAATRQRSANSLLIQAVTNFVEREEKREAIRLECIEAHEEYMRTGLHLTGEEVDAWADQLLQGNKADLPKCHV